MSNFTSRKMPCLLLLCLALTVLSGCQNANDSNAAKLTEVSYLDLNEGKPGTPVDLFPYLVPGKYTIVEFYSPYDEVSPSLNPKLVQLAQSRSDLAVRVININRPEVQQVDWQSPIMQNEQFNSMPYFRIYDPTRSLRAQGRPAREQIEQWVQAL